MKPISEDLRSRVIAAVEAGLSRRAAADRFGVAVASAVRWVRDWRESGTARAKPQGGDKRSQRIEAYRDVILTAIESQVDITLVELAELLRAEHGALFAPSTIWRSLDHHAMTLKKTAHASEQDRPDVLARRRARFKGQSDLDPERLVFIDGSGADAKGIKPAPRRRWHGLAGGQNAARAADPRSRTGIGRRQPSRALCA